MERFQVRDENLNEISVDSRKIKSFIPYSDGCGIELSDGKTIHCVNKYATKIKIKKGRAEYLVNSVQDAMGNKGFLN